MLARAFVIAALVTLAGLPRVGAQSPAFEAASIKPNRSGDQRSILVPQSGGRFTATNVTAGALIRFAYDRPDFQVAGGPDWLASDRFDVIAKAEGDPPREQIRLMLRTLLSERFTLAAHTETRDLPVFALVVARSDGRLGPQIRRTQADCARALPSSGPPYPNGPPACDYFGPAPDRKSFAFRGMTMEAVARLLVPMVRRSVSDQTRLSGYFDGEFGFTAELGPPPPPPGVQDPLDRSSLPTVFTVLSEQLGLKLDARRGPVEILVIDHAEQPTPD